MENFFLTIHLIVALILIGLVLMQRSEGGIGLGGGGGGGGATSGRPPASAMTKFTWLFALAFLGTSITLTIIAASNSADESVITGELPAAGAPAPLEIPLAPLGADAPAAPPPAE
ncbi:preprotein translocase subunit SecG [Abyssibius alkaniclasticus]|uniref:preprotein translocase subunit SecG n=1 Tax=Abyssibius alkaniclasticus TaxID=2881234 RepID=UPI0040596323